MTEGGDRMKASVVDLRYRMKEVLRALRRRETVEILYHGKTAGIITPPNHSSKKKDIAKHPFFGLRRHDKDSVDSIMDKLRAPRYRDI